MYAKTTSKPSQFAIVTFKEEDEEEENSQTNSNIPQASVSDRDESETSLLKVPSNDEEGNNEESSLSRIEQRLEDVKKITKLEVSYYPYF